LDTTRVQQFARPLRAHHGSQVPTAYCRLL
jgi:hypothetical protein